jgi:serine/threonine protein kinase
MSAAVGPCPSVDELDRLLSEQLEEPARDVVEAHVEVCSSCQDRLDQRIGTAPALSSTWVESQAQKDTPQPRDGFLDRLKRLPKPAPAWQAAPAYSLEHGRIGQYEILGKLGQGGMGAVYRARHLELGKQVALKILPTDQMYELNIARFKREIRASGQLEHPNIVTAHDAGQYQGVHYLAMSLVDGIDLSELVARHGPLPAADACELARQAALGLQYIADQGLVHRDIKPSNLMLARDGRVKLLDLGLARSVGDATATTMTMTGAMIGTADYLAPEQWDHPQSADARADIYSLGCTLYFLLAGRAPFADLAHNTVLAKMHAHQNVAPPPITRFRPDLPPALVDALNQMLAKKPENRFASCSLVASALETFATGCSLPDLLQTIALTPAPSFGESSFPSSRLRYAHRSRRSYLIAAALLAAACLAPAALLMWPRPESVPGPEASRLALTDLQITHWDKEKKLIGDLASSARAVVVDEGVQVSGRMSAPSYFYVIAFNPQGSADGIEQLGYPADNGTQKASDIPPALHSTLRYPSGQDCFVPDAAGLQVLVIAASTKPLPAFSQWQKRAGKIPWTGPKVGGDWRGVFDGRAYVRFPRERGRIESRESAPKALRDLCDFFLARPEFEMVTVIAFPVTDGRK